jgi:hypothetical protein
VPDNDAKATGDGSLAVYQRMRCTRGRTRTVAEGLSGQPTKMIESDSQPLGGTR